MKSKIFNIQNNKKYFDLMCGMELESPRVKYKIQRKGRTYYFCNKSYRDHFQSDPELYTSS